MDKNILDVKKQRIMRTIESLQENNMNGYLVKDKDELIDKIKEIVKERI